MLLVTSDYETVLSHLIVIIVAEQFASNPR